MDPPAAWPEWAIGPFVRYGGNPLLRPQGTGWESRNTYNPGVLFDQGKFRMLYRAQARGQSTSRIGYGEAPDEVTFKTNPDPLIDATELFEQKYGAEDPRFYKYQGTYYTFYTGNHPGIAECEATSPDGTHWTKLGVIENGTKNAAVVCDPNGTPVKINGKFVMYIGDTHFHLCYSDDMVHWGPMTPIKIPVPATWRQPFEVCVAVTDYDPAHPDNIVVFIGGTLNGQGRWFYALSETLFSKKDLATEVDVLPDCIMKPRETYESGTFQELPVDERHHPARRAVADVLRRRGQKHRAGHGPREVNRCLWSARPWMPAMPLQHRPEGKSIISEGKPLMTDKFKIARPRVSRWPSAANWRPQHLPVPTPPLRWAGRVPRC